MKAEWRIQEAVFLYAKALDKNLCISPFLEGSPQVVVFLSSHSTLTRAALSYRRCTDTRSSEYPVLVDESRKLPISWERRLCVQFCSPGFRCTVITHLSCLRSRMQLSYSACLALWFLFFFHLLSRWIPFLTHDVKSLTLYDIQWPPHTRSPNQITRQFSYQWSVIFSRCKIW